MSVWAGVGALGGAVIILILTVPLFMRKAAPQFMKLGDQRLKVVREIMDGIKIVKIHAWENAFQTKLEAIRTEQLGWLKKFNIGVTCFVVVGQVISNFHSSFLLDLDRCIVGKHHHASRSTLPLWS